MNLHEMEEQFHILGFEVKSNYELHSIPIKIHDKNRDLSNQ